MLYLVRHAATENNLARPPLLQGRNANPPLSAEGHKQAAVTAVQLADLPISAVYSSPLERAMQTGIAIAKNHNVPCQAVDELIEADVGDWGGRTWNEIASSETEAYQNFISNPAEHPYAGGENFTEVSQRTLPIFDRLLETHRGTSIAVIGHNVVNRVFLAHLAGISLAKSREIKQANCGINVVRRRDSKNELVTLNATFHLGADSTVSDCVR